VGAPDPEPEAEATSASASASSNGASADGAGAPSEEKLRLGGMALRNGLLIHGPTSWAAAARAPGGAIETASGPKPDFGGNRLAKVPIVRGPVRMAEAFAVIPIARRSLRSARLPFEDLRVIGAGVATTLLSAAIRGPGERVGPIREGIVGALSLAPALVALTGSDLAAYHAVEHKAIAGYEQDADPTAVPKEHERCGSNLIAPMIIFSVATQVVVDRLVESPGRLVRGLSSVVGLSLSVETFVHAEKHPDSALGRAIHASGTAIQRLFATREPSAEQLEVGVAALAAALAAEHG